MCRRHESTLAPTRSAPAEARHLVAQECSEFQVRELTDTAELLTSELVTNAVVHTGQSARLGVALANGRLVVEVADSEPTPPEIVDAGPDRAGGRGLALVSMLADEWGVRPDDGGKVVWFALRPSQPPPDAGGCSCSDTAVRASREN